MITVNKYLYVIAAIVFVLFNSDAYASTAIGIDLKAGEYNLRVVYNVSQWYKKDEIRYIQEPDKLLFDLISVIQANYDSISKEEMNITIEVMGYGNENFTSGAPELFVRNNNYVESLERSFGFSYSVPYKMDHLSLLERYVCAFVPSECSLGRGNPDDEIFLYKTSNEFLAQKTGIVKFGALPSYTEKPYYVLRPRKGTEKKFEKVIIKRSEMNKYFERLDD